MPEKKSVGKIIVRGVPYAGAALSVSLILELFNEYQEAKRAKDKAKMAEIEESFSNIPVQMWEDIKNIVPNLWEALLNVGLRPYVKNTIPTYAQEKQCDLQLKEERPDEWERCIQALKKNKPVIIESSAFSQALKATQDYIKEKYPNQDSPTDSPSSGKIFSSMISNNNKVNVIPPKSKVTPQLLLEAVDIFQRKRNNSSDINIYDESDFPVQEIPITQPIINPNDEAGALRDNELAQLAVIAATQQNQFDLLQKHLKKISEQQMNQSISKSQEPITTTQSTNNQSGLVPIKIEVPPSQKKEKPEPSLTGWLFLASITVGIFGAIHYFRK